MNDWMIGILLVIVFWAIVIVIVLTEDKKIYKSAYECGVRIENLQDMDIKAYKEGKLLVVGNDEVLITADCQTGEVEKL